MLDEFWIQVSEELGSRWVICCGNPAGCPPCSGWSTRCIFSLPLSGGALAYGQGDTEAG